MSSFRCNLIVKWKHYEFENLQYINIRTFITLHVQGSVIGLGVRVYS